MGGSVAVERLGVLVGTAVGASGSTSAVDVAVGVDVMICGGKVGCCALGLVTLSFARERAKKPAQ